MDDKQFSQEIDGIKGFIEDYLLTRCRIKGKLQSDTKELEVFFRNTPASKEELERHKLEVSTYVRQCMLWGHEYRIDTYKQHIEFKEVEIHNEHCRVTLTTDESRKYRCTEEITFVKEIPHTIVLYRHRGRWCIEQHLTTLEFVDTLLTYQKVFRIETLMQAQELYLDEVSTIKENTKAYSVKSIDEGGHYNRQKAIEYALEKVLEPLESEESQEESKDFVLRCLEEGAWDLCMPQTVGSENELRLGDVVKITHSREGKKNMIVTGYIRSLMDSCKITGYLVSQHKDYEKNIPLATKPYPREYILIN
ncbi:MAG: hypothetical protein ACRCTE_02490 [Cellulosilyticaceae bacterium]